MIFSLFCRQSNILKNVRYLMSSASHITNKLIVKQQVIHNKSINTKSNIIQSNQIIRYFSLTKSKYAKSEHNSCAQHWKYERILSVALLIIYPTAFLAPSLIMDYALITATVIHYYCAMDGITLDYVRPILFGKFIPKVAHMWVIVFSLSVLYGLVQFRRNDIGVINAIQKILAMKGGEKKRDKAENCCELCKPAPDVLR